MLAACLPGLDGGRQIPIDRHLGRRQLRRYTGLVIKPCGYDGILVRRISPEPVHVLIDNHAPQLKSAGHLSVGIPQTGIPNQKPCQSRDEMI